MEDNEALQAEINLFPDISIEHKVEVDGE